MSSRSLGFHEARFAQIFIFFVAGRTQKQQTSGRNALLVKQWRQSRIAALTRLFHLRVLEEPFFGGRLSGQCLFALKFFASVSSGSARQPGNKRSASSWKDQKASPSSLRFVACC